ncbi:MAG: MBL fold metallo-hydrolase [Paracoccaceae bacterium]
MIQGHTHIDHIGALSDFPNVPIVIAEAERALPKPIYWEEAQPIEWPDQEYVHFTEDTNIGPGFEVLLVPGHAPEQLALLIESPETGCVLLTSDAISRPAEIAQEFEGSWDQALARQHSVRLVEIAERTGAVNVYGHSPEQWPTLWKAPQTYTLLQVAHK